VRSICTAVLLVLMCGQVSAQAMQGCPNGLPAGTPGCIPPNDPRSPVQSAAQGRWIEQWAAISIGDTGGIGAFTNPPD